MTNIKIPSSSSFSAINAVEKPDQTAHVTSNYKKDIALLALIVFVNYNRHGEIWGKGFLFPRFL